MRPPKMILGVCAWLSEKLDLDVTGIRIVFAIAMVFGFGTPLLAYIILYLIMPKA